MLYCLICDQNYDQESLGGDFICPRCNQGIAPEGAAYPRDMLAELHKRRDAVLTIMQERISEAAAQKLVEGANNGLISAYEDAIKLVDRKSKKDAIHGLKNRIIAVEADRQNG